MYLVAYDGSEYAQGALLRAVGYADLKEVDVEAFTVIPDTVDYARDRKWISANDEYDFEDIVQDLHERVTTLAPMATFNYQKMAANTSAGRIARQIRERAVDKDAEVVFLGSEEAGRVTTSLTNVENSVAAETEYDVHIVRTSPRNMTDLDPDQREEWLQQTDRQKPSWGSDTLSQPPDSQ